MQKTECIICGKQPIHIHHIYTRGAHGEKACCSANEIPLCVYHHFEAHNLGRKRFADKYCMTDIFSKAEDEVRGQAGVCCCDKGHDICDQD